MITRTIIFPRGLKYTAKLCLNIVAKTDWIELRDDCDQPLKIPTQGDVYSVAFVTPPANETRWAGDLRLSRIGTRKTHIQIIAKSDWFYPFFAILQNELDIAKKKVPLQT